MRGSSARSSLTKGAGMMQSSCNKRADGAPAGSGHCSAGGHWGHEQCVEAMAAGRQRQAEGRGEGAAHDKAGGGGGGCSGRAHGQDADAGRTTCLEARCCGVLFFQKTSRALVEEAGVHDAQARSTRSRGERARLEDATAATVRPLAIGPAPPPGHAVSFGRLLRRHVWRDMGWSSHASRD